MSRPLERLEGIARDLFELDVDLRLRALWAIADELEEDDWNRDRAGIAMRAAYAIGYADALLEAGRNTGELLEQYRQRRLEGSA